MILKTVLYIFVIYYFPLMCFADSPTRGPYDYRTCSFNGAYCAQVTADHGIEVMRILAKNNEQLLRVIPGWYPQVFLTNDGHTLITVGTDIVPGYDFDQPIVKFYVGDRLAKSLLVKELIGNQRMGRTTSGFHWGDPIGFSSDELSFSFSLDGGQSLSIPLPRQ